MSDSIPLPPVLSGKLTDFRRRVWTVKLAEGLLAAVFGLGVSYLLVLGLDRFLDTPAWLRGLLLAAGATVPGLALPLKWHRWVWRQRRLEDAARLLRWKFPRVGDQLLGIVELAKQDSATGRSERLVLAAMAQADDAVKGLDFGDAVPRASHRRWGVAAAGACALVASGCVLMNDASRNAMVRWLMPWTETERFTFARVEALPNPLVVPIAEPFTLPVKLAPETRWSPGTASAKVAGQATLSAPLEANGYSLKVSPQASDAGLFVKVGDVREEIRLEPRPRPELTALRVRMKLPAYLQYSTEPVTEVRGGSVSVLKGALATFEAAASRRLARAEIDGHQAQIDGDRVISEAGEVRQNRAVTFHWTDTLGLTPKEPLTLKVQPVEDESPRLVARRQSLEQVVLDSEVIHFEIAATDDYGIREVGLEWKGLNDGTGSEVIVAKGSKVAAAGAAETKQLDAKATFSAKREGVEPQTIEVRAWAQDFRPGGERARSAIFVLHVLNPDDHALWVTQQMARWLEAAKETYEREQRLHETNKEIRSLSAAELDRPDTRRRIATQASSEVANGERLNSLTNSGRQLVEHATKNEEFDAKRLESWALMLRSLEDIARNRMPSVADLLKKSADAKPGMGLASDAGAQNQAPNPGNSSPPNEGAEPNNGGESQTAQNQPANGQGKMAVPADSQSAPTLTQGPSSPKSGGPQIGNAPASTPKKSDPSIALNESTMNTPKPGGTPSPPGKAGAASLTLPANSLAMPPKKFKQPPPAGSAGDSLDQGIEEQRDLLAEFAKVSDQLNEILVSLESSTFVKRFKAASRQQTQLAGGLGAQALVGFGIARGAADRTPSVIAAASEPEAASAPESAPPPVPDSQLPRDPAPLATREETDLPFVTTYAPVAKNKAKTQSEVVKLILSDLEAYFQRKADLHVKKVIGEMKEVRVVPELARVGERAEDNYTGNAIHAAELWADIMDRWAEEMVSVGKAFC